MNFEDIDFFPLKKNARPVKFLHYILFLKGKRLFVFDSKSRESTYIGEYGESYLFLAEEKEEEAEVYLVKKDSREVLRLSFFYPEKGVGGIRLDTYSIPLRFKLSENISCDSLGRDLIVADAENKRYFIVRDMRGIYGAPIEVDHFVIARFFDKHKAFIITDRGIYVIIEGIRSFISSSRLGFEPTAIQGFRMVEDRGKRYLLLASPLKVVVISLEGEDKFYFGVFARSSFKSFKPDSEQSF